MPALRILLALFFLIGFAACGDDDSPTDSDGGNNNNNGADFSNKVSGTINGDSWTATNAAATRNAAGGIVALTFVAYGTDASQITFGIAFGSAKAFTIDGAAVQAGFNYGGESYGENESGTVTVSTLTDKGMKGTFTINAKTKEGEAGTATGSFDVAFN